MLLIELNALENGAHRNQLFDGSLEQIPDGFAVVSEELEETALQYLPFIKITSVVDGVIVGVEQGTIPEPAPESEPQATLDDRVTALEGDTEELHEAPDMILTGVTE